MTVGRRSRRRTRYYVLRIDGHDERIARITPQGSPSSFDVEAGTWVHDPLLGAEIRLSDDWVRVPSDELPDSAVGGEPADTTGTRRGRTPKGRHAQAGPGSD